MLLKLILFSGIVFLKIDILLSQRNILTQDQFCGVNNKSNFHQFYVTNAFKIGQYIGVVGRLWKKGQKESEAKDAVIRVIHHQKDPTGHTSFTFFDAKVWNEILKIYYKKSIKYTFSTDNMYPIFADQKMSELVYMVEDTNKTNAYQFNYSRIESMEVPTYDPKSDKKLVYDPSIDFDETQYLSFRFLLLHIPIQLKIIAVMIYDRTPHNSEYVRHYAIVYTEEMFEGKPYYFRHYMKSERDAHKVFRGEDISNYRLDWFIDDTIDYCDQLTDPPTAVVLLRKEMFTEKWNFKIVDEIYFVEFYGLKHNLLKLRFDSIYHITLKLTLKEEDSEKHIDNAEALLNCKQHPIFTLSKPIACVDYPNQIKDQMNGKDIFVDESRKYDNSLSVLSIIIVAVLVVIIVAVMVYSLYSVLSMDANNQNTDDI